LQTCTIINHGPLPIIKENLGSDEDEPPQLTKPLLFKRLKEPGVGNMFSFFKGVEMRDVYFGGEKHMGIYANEFLPKGTVIFESDPLERETRAITRDDINKFDVETRLRWWIYCWQLDDDVFSGPRIDISLDEALPRDGLNFINHSCDPNIGYDGDDVLITMRDVEVGEMICYDYAMSETDPEAFPEFECECGSQYCRGRIKFSDYMLLELQQRYTGRFLNFVSRKQREALMVATNFKASVVSKSKDIIY